MYVCKATHHFLICPCSERTEIGKYSQTSHHRASTVLRFYLTRLPSPCPRGMSRSFYSKKSGCVFTRATSLQDVSFLSYKWIIGRSEPDEESHVDQRTINGKIWVRRINHCRWRRYGKLELRSKTTLPTNKSSITDIIFKSCFTNGKENFRKSDFEHSSEYLDSATSQNPANHFLSRTATLSTAKESISMF